jgi:hypothetical protein
LLALHLPELVDSIHVVLVRDKAVSVRVAIFADVDGGTFDAVVVSASLVNGACLISDIVSMDEIEGTVGLTTVAAKVIIRA